jgi:hypothetical protein
MKIAIVGLGRCGSTAMFFQIKNALPETARCLFEPASVELGDEPVVLVKVLLSLTDPQRFEFDRLDAFDKKIFLVRDPRDALVSALLYTMFNSVEFCSNEALVRAVLDKLGDKQARPRAVPFFDLLRLPGPFGLGDDKMAWIRQIPLVSMRFHDRHPDYFVVKYEDFVDGRIEPLERYLGLGLERQVKVPDAFSRVTRTRAYGDWKNWFLDEDLAEVRPLVAPYLERYGYPQDWRPGEAPAIVPEHGTEYLRRIVNEVRRREGLPEL